MTKSSATHPTVRGATHPTVRGATTHPTVRGATHPTVRGATAEAVAATHLEQAGLVVLHRNYRIRGGEIDLIAKHGEVTVFVEVKQRTSHSHGFAGEFINPRKAALVRRAALHFLGRDDLPCRFDAVLLEGKQNKVTWIQDAF